MDDRLERRRELLIPRGVLRPSSAPQGVFGQASSDGDQSLLGSSVPQGLLDQASKTGGWRDGKRTTGEVKRRSRNSYSSYRKAVGKRGSASYSSYRKSVGKRNMLSNHDLNNYYWWLQLNN